MISASRLRRIRRCPASGALPQVQTESEASNRGRVIHRFIELASKHGRDYALSEMDADTRDVCEAIDLDALPTHLAHEVAYAFDVMTGKVRRTERGYPDIDDMEIGVTIDVEGVGDGRVYVADYKSGFRSVAKPAENEQVSLGALCSARYHGMDEATVEVIYVREGRRPWRETATLDIFDLDAFAADLRRIWDRYQDAREVVAAGQTPDVTEGEHCRYCPAADYCPAKHALLRRMVNGDAGIEVEHTFHGRVTGEHYRMWQAMKQLTDRVGSIIHAAAAEEPIDLGDGKLYAKVDKPGSEVIDGDTAYEVAREEYGQDYADDAVERKASKAGLRRALKGRAGNMAEAERELLAKIKDRGGVSRRPPSSRFEEIPAKLPKADDAA